MTKWRKAPSPTGQVYLLNFPYPLARPYGGQIADPLLLALQYEAAHA